MAFVHMLAALEAAEQSGVKPGLLERRYGIPVEPLSGDGAPKQDVHGWLTGAAERHTSGDTSRMAQRFLDDFRRGMLGPIALELP
jgi:ribosome biogenesis GTPase A